MIHLEKLNEKTFTKTINMKLAPGQEKFVASNLYSIAQAWLYDDEARPMVIMNDNEPVGFLMIDWNEDERTAGIWRFMIDAEHQHQGFGRKAMIIAIDYIKQADKFDLIHLSYVPENTTARDLYYSIGFRENGENAGDEIVMTLPLTDKPRVGMTIAREEDLEDINDFFQKEKQKTIIPDAFSDGERLIEMIKNNQIIRFTIMGYMIGLSDGKNTFIGSDYKKYYSEVLEKVTVKVV